jgi:DNA gyrase subunit A
VLDRVLSEELREIKRVHATPRRSRIVGSGIAAEQVLAGGSQAGFEAQDVTVQVTRGGYLKPLARRRTTPGHKHPHDPLAAVVRASTDDTLLLVEENGAGHRVGVADLPIARANQRGTHVGGLLGGGPGTSLAGAVPLVADPDVTVVTVSAAGQVKRTPISEFVEARQRSLQAAGVKPGDRIVGVALCRDSDHLLLAHDGGLVTRFPAAEVRAMGRTAAGVGGMNLPEGASIVSLSIAPGGTDDAEVLTLGADGSAKRSPLSDYPVKGRGGKGLLTGTDALLWCGVATDLHLGGEDGAVLRPVDVPESRRAGRGTLLEPPAVGPIVAEHGPQARPTD